MFKLFPSVCALQILWKFVPNCWPAHAESAAAKTSGSCTWNQRVSNTGAILWANGYTVTISARYSMHRYMRQFWLGGLELA